MSRRDEASYEVFENLREAAREKVHQGDWSTALTLYEEALVWAEEHGSKDDLHLAHCNRAGILITRGQGRRAVGKMRQILLSNSNPDICYHAAYNVSRFHEFRKETKRGLFYARLCLDHAKLTGKSEPEARARNQIGHLLVCDSYFEEACECYEQALVLVAEDSDLDRTLILANIGYCQIMVRSYTEGFARLFESLRLARRCRAEAWEMMARLGLSFAYLEIDRPQRALGHARRGLELAQEAESPWQIKNALYLLGEAEKLSGNELAAHGYFSRLQEDFFPDNPFVPDLLMATDVRKLINLMA